MTPSKLGTGVTAMERFMSFVDKDPDTGCWRWMGFREPTGNYSRFQVNGRTVYGHRFAYEQFIGPIPKGLAIDHVAARGCKYRDCVNPDHLEAVTPGENVRRSDGITTANSRKTHCWRNHPLSGDNLYLHQGRSGLQRHCKQCQRENGRLTQWLRRALHRTIRELEMTYDLG